jgi:hypothetical protein
MATINDQLMGRRVDDYCSVMMTPKNNQNNTQNADGRKHANGYSAMATMATTTKN